MKKLLFIFSLILSVNVFANDTITVAKAVEIASGLSSGGVTDSVYTIKGYVVDYYATKKDPGTYSEAYKNMSVYIADEETTEINQTKQLIAFRVKPVSKDSVPVPGDLVLVTGKITRYYQLYETTQGGTITIVNKGVTTGLTEDNPTTDVETAIETPIMNSKVSYKQLKDGQVIVIINDKKYTILGQEIE